MVTRNAQRKKGTVIRIIAGVALAINVISSVAVFMSIWSLGFIPEKYLAIVAAILFVLNLFFGFMWLSHRVNSINKIMQTIMCILLSALMITGSVLIPQYKLKIENIFMGFQEVTELKINMYVLSDNDRKDITEFDNVKVGIHQSYDKQHLGEAIDEINKHIDNDIIVSLYENMFDLVQDLYDGKIEAILLNSSYVNLIVDNEEYGDFLDRTRVFYTITQEIVNKHASSFTGAVTKSPFVILLGGEDSFDYSNISSTEGDWNPHGGNRTDVNMLVVVNPITKQVLLVSIPRDTYVPLMGNQDMMDKLTHSSVINVDTWENCVASIFDNSFNIDFFFRVNFSTLVRIVDTLGGISFYNPYAFQSIRHEIYENGYLVKRSYWYPEGDITLDGNRTLLYVRERMNLPEGDVSRNKNTARVLKALIKKVTSPEIIQNVNSLLETMNGTFLTDMTFKQISSLVKMQINDMAEWSIVTRSLNSIGPYYRYCYLLGYNASVVDIDENTVETAKNAIQSVLNGDIIDD